MTKKKQIAEIELHDQENIELPAADVVPEEELIKVKLNTNVKFNDARYSLGEEIDVSQEDYEILLKAGVVDGDDT
jgi:hypothetical protein